jgi:hypothetical protein
MTVHAVADIRLITNNAEYQREQSPNGKAYLMVVFPDGTKFNMTLNLAQMIGGVAKGSAIRLGYQKE